MESEVQQSSFKGWAVIEMMGHRKEIGFVTTEYYGGAALFRVDTPSIDEHEETMDTGGYVRGPDGTMYAPAGSTVKRAAIESRSVFVSPNSLYAMNPCTEEVARLAVKRSAYDNRTPILLKLPERAAIEAGNDDSDHEEPF